MHKECKGTSRHALYDSLIHFRDTTWHENFSVRRGGSESACLPNRQAEFIPLRLGAD